MSDLPGKRETALVAALAAIAGIGVAAVFTIHPSLDIEASGLFLGSTGNFLFDDSTYWAVMRTLSMRGFAVWYVAIVICGLLAWKSRRPVARLDMRQWLYLAETSIIGPLLVVNVILKEHWGRWRPREVLELGGSHRFTPPLDLSGSCADNCSFVSGEVSSMVMIFIALAFVSRRWRPLFYALTLVMGGLSGLIRVGQGGHFLSDALFAAVFMVLIAAATYWLMFLRGRPSSEPGRIIAE